MYLKYCDINNFRSIKKLRITFDNNFQILVGFNEAGKSNIFKALSYVVPEIEPNEDDIRDPGHDEEPIEKSFLRFVFGLDASETNNIFDELKPLFKAKNFDCPIMEYGNNELSLEELCRSRKEGLYDVDLLSKKKSPRYWSTSIDEYSSVGNWKKVPDGWRGYDDLEHNSFRYINVLDFPKYEEDEELEDISPKEVLSLIGAEICSLVSSGLPDCIVWNYTENNVLPGEVDISDFGDDPSVCEPLRNIFYLGGYHDIAATIEDAQSKTNGVRNLLRKLSSNATKHLNDVWAEYKSVSINLIENGNFIEMGIEDRFNIYSLSRRSDGFKRFITFLLMISAKVKANYISNTIILIDEPDIGLHPTGVSFLRDELEKISKNNTVVVSSHSIFMIDKERVDRHLVVKKEDEVTRVTCESVSDILDEEVIYRALGFSFVELLKKRNIVFEGWRDKHTFQRWLKSTSLKADIRRSWKNIGMTHALGVKDVARVASLLESVGREYIILTDSDKPALERKNKFEGDGVWLTYSDLGFKTEETVEDFLKETYIDKMISRVLQKEQIKTDETFKDCRTYNEKIKKICGDVSLSKTESKRIDNLIKNQIFEEIPPKEINLLDLVDCIMKKAPQLFVEGE